MILLFINIPAIMVCLIALCLETNYSQYTKQLHVSQVELTDTL